MTQKNFLRKNNLIIKSSSSLIADNVFDKKNAFSMVF